MLDNSTVRGKYLFQCVTYCPYPNFIFWSERIIIINLYQEGQMVNHRIIEHYNKYVSWIFFLPYYQMFMEREILENDALLK